jgi:antitoxin (DNA-binding transcriptional repressor) of toxin-antitoxin stability system
MNSIPLHDAQARLAESIHNLVPGEVLTITENDQPIAQLVPVPVIQQRPPRPRPPVTGMPKAGSCKGLFVVPDDFKEPLEDMREYME